MKVLEHAVVGKQPTSPAALDRKARSTAAAVIGAGTVVSTGAIVFAGATVGKRVILGDQSCVRERVTIGNDVVVGRGSLVENDTTIGALTKIQAGAYITAYSTLEEQVFVAPCVVTTNDNFMGRTERRHELMKGPTIRRGARIGGGAILCPGIEVARRRSSAAGAVVTKDVPPRGRRRGPARVLRESTTNCSTPSGVARRLPRPASLRARAARLRTTQPGDNDGRRREVGGSEQ